MAKPVMFKLHESRQPSPRIPIELFSKFCPILIPFDITRRIASRVARQGIRCNVIVPILSIRLKPPSTVQASFFDRCFSARPLNPKIRMT
jgi:hypothetical protein